MPTLSIVKDYLVSGSDLLTIYRQRKPGFIYLIVPKGKEQSYLEDDWTIYRINKKCKHRLDNGLCASRIELDLPNKFDECPLPWYIKIWRWIKNKVM